MEVAILSEPTTQGEMAYRAIAGDSLPAAEQAELDAWVDAEVRASGQRAAAVLDDLREWIIGSSIPAIRSGKTISASTKAPPSWWG